MLSLKPLLTGGVTVNAPSSVTIPILSCFACVGLASPLHVILKHEASCFHGSARIIVSSRKRHDRIEDAIGPALGKKHGIPSTIGERCPLKGTI
jgi:hypothetical protein